MTKTPIMPNAIEMICARLICSPRTKLAKTQMKIGDVYTIADVTDKESWPSAMKFANVDETKQKDLNKTNMRVDSASRDAGLPRISRSIAVITKWMA